jgi:hypothetical protein
MTAAEDKHAGDKTIVVKIVFPQGRYYRAAARGSTTLRPLLSMLLASDRPGLLLSATKNEKRRRVSFYDER